MNAVYHFTFTGKEEKQATVTIRDATVQVQDGHQGEADLRVIADSETWLGFLAKERSLLWALLRRLNAAGTTIILTTHYLEEAEELCERIAIIETGHLVALEGTQKLIGDRTLQDVFLELTRH